MDILKNKLNAVEQPALNKNTSHTEAVSAFIPEGYEHNFNIRIVAGTNAGIKQLSDQCQPRLNATRRDAEPLDLPSSIKGRFPEINKQFMEWMMKSGDHAALFLTNPLDALQKAGIKLSREEQKHVSRNFDEIQTVSVIPAAALIGKFSTVAAKGKIRRVEEVKINAFGSAEKDCGCNK